MNVECIRSESPKGIEKIAGGKSRLAGTSPPVSGIFPRDPEGVAYPALSGQCRTTSMLAYARSSVESRRSAGTDPAQRDRPVSPPRSSNRTRGFPASGSPTGFESYSGRWQLVQGPKSKVYRQPSRAITDAGRARSGIGSVIRRWQPCRSARTCSWRPFGSESWRAPIRRRLDGGSRPTAYFVGRHR